MANIGILKMSIQLQLAVSSEYQLNKCLANLKGDSINLEVTTVTYLPKDL